MNIIVEGKNVEVKDVKERGSLTYTPGEYKNLFDYINLVLNNGQYSHEDIAINLFRYFAINSMHNVRSIGIYEDGAVAHYLSKPLMQEFGDLYEDFTHMFDMFLFSSVMEGKQFKDIGNKTIFLDFDKSSHHFSDVAFDDAMKINGEYRGVMLETYSKNGSDFYSSNFIHIDCHNLPINHERVIKASMAIEMIKDLNLIMDRFPSNSSSLSDVESPGLVGNSFLEDYDMSGIVKGRTEEMLMEDLIYGSDIKVRKEWLITSLHLSHFPSAETLHELLTDLGL